MCTVVGAANDPQLEAGHITDALLVNENDAMLLQIVSLAGNEGRRLLPVRQANEDALSVRRIGLLRLTNERLKDDAPHLLLAVQRMTPLELRPRTCLVDALQKLVLIPFLLRDGQFLRENGHVLVVERLLKEST